MCAWGLSLVQEYIDGVGHGFNGLADRGRCDGELCLIEVNPKFGG